MSFAIESNKPITPVLAQPLPGKDVTQMPAFLAVDLEEVAQVVERGRGLA